jgi:hypothetical protein
MAATDFATRLAAAAARIRGPVKSPIEQTNTPHGSAAR